MAIKRERTKRDSTRPRMSEMPKRKCKLCEDQVEVDYKQPELLRRFITERGKIVGRHSSGACAKHQREITLAIKRARVMLLVR
ncbi:MAG: 30S ribosomal protein S18 [Verrucomicrobia bacterium]|nr:30S ribosomal protein S18 [Verrucomicrobiota bacterium]